MTVSVTNYGYVIPADEKCYADGKLISEEAPECNIGKITKTEYNIKVEK